MPTLHRLPALLLLTLTLTLMFTVTSRPSLAASSWIGPNDAVVCYERAIPPGGGDAIDACTMAIRHGDLTLRDLAATYTNRGILWARAGKTRKALRDYERSLKINPNSPHTWLNQANLYARSGKHAKAMGSYATAIELSNESWALPFFNRALTRLDQGDRLAARSDLLRAVTLEPHTLKYREVLAGTEFAQHEPAANEQP